MGLGMACAAARAGHEVTGHTRGRAEHERLTAAGGVLRRDLASVVDGKDAVCINVFDATQVSDVVYTHGVLSRLAPGTMLILHTTSAPDLATKIAHDAPVGVTVLDCAFSGSPQQAQAGALTLMAGGDAAAFTRAEPLLTTYASYLRHVGPLGAGMRLKLLNNLLFASQIALAGDVFRIAGETGMQAAVVADVISRSSGASAALGILARHPQPTTGSEGMRTYLRKDVASAIAAAESEGLDLGTLMQLTRNLL